MTNIQDNSQEREELHKSIWAIADDLRGAVDGWDFKNYVLGVMFYRFISENISHYVQDWAKNAGDDSFVYADCPDDEIDDNLRQQLIAEKGFFIYPSQLFCTVLKNAKQDLDLNINLGNIFKAIESATKGTESEHNFAGLFDDIDLHSNKLGGNVPDRNKRLVKILEGVDRMKLRYQNGIDAFGDAYEYLMSMYASNAGKSGGEFFTPQEVSQLLARIATIGKTSVDKVYDPACGSGSLLLQVSKVLGNDKVGDGFFGQEINITTYNLCRINMFLHNVSFNKFDIVHQDTLLKPMHSGMEFEVIVSNPPYSIKWDGDANPTLIDDPRYSPAGVLAPKSKADLAFVMHSLHHLKNSGTAAIVCFPGIFYRSGAEQKIRQYLIDKNLVDAVIALPNNLFYGTPISTYVLVLKSSRPNMSTVQFVDASQEFVKITNNNRLSQSNISRIVEAIRDKQDQEYFSKNVSIEAIKEQNYNLSVSTYISKRDERQKIDIDQLNAMIVDIVKKQVELREAIDDIVATLQSSR
ncbi:MAG: type I restriction-modification system subunit M [Firmicutes bacterium]|nr:type I restriction-modification system subunit M [Bacillota bacterium]MCL1953417.1 type I restriction-modification system subunit M [Bacillota bacterium]